MKHQTTLQAIADRGDPIPYAYPANESALTAIGHALMTGKEPKHLDLETVHSQAIGLLNFTSRLLDSLYTAKDYEGLDKSGVLDLQSLINLSSSALMFVENVRYAYKQHQHG